MGCPIVSRLDDSHVPIICHVALPVSNSCTTPQDVHGSFRQTTWRPSCILCMHQFLDSSVACPTTCCSSAQAHSSFAATSSPRSLLSGSFPSDGIHNYLSTSSAHQFLFSTSSYISMFTQICCSFSISQRTTLTSASTGILTASSRRFPVESTSLYKPWVACPACRDQRLLGTNVLSRRYTSILLLALCTLRAIRVTVSLMRFTRIHFCVRVDLTLVTSLANDHITRLDSLVRTLLVLLGVSTQLSRVTERYNCDIDDPFSLLSLWELSRIVTATETIWSMCCTIGNSTVFLQLNHGHLSSQDGTTSLMSMYWIWVETSEWRPPLLKLQALVVATQLHIHHLIRELQLV